MNICLTGGGTGGHLMIAQALLEALIIQGHKAIFIGSTTGQDRKYFESEERFEEVYFLQTTGVVNQKGLGKLEAIKKIYKAFVKSRDILNTHKIDAVYSVGGFSAAPASFASLVEKVPLFIHEQNAVAGRLNAILKPFAASFISAYDKDSSIKGYPVKEIFYRNARTRKKIKTVIFLGGSHGARAINDLAIGVIPQLKKRGIKIIHQAGENDFNRVKELYRNLDVEVKLYSFCDDLASLIIQADLAISRAGASTLWELTTNKCPAFYVPYPYAAGDHQYHNASFIVDNKLGWCQREGADLKEKLIAILDDDLELKSRGLAHYSTKDVASEMIIQMQRIVEL